jgi:hypothetical protein
VELGLPLGVDEGCTLGKELGVTLGLPLGVNEGCVLG